MTWLRAKTKKHMIRFRCRNYYDGLMSGEQNSGQVSYLQLKLGVGQLGHHWPGISDYQRRSHNLLCWAKF